MNREDNQRRIEFEIDEGTVSVESMPYELQFSPEHRCNLRCVQCYSTVVRNQGVVPLMDKRLPNNTLKRFGKLESLIPTLESVSLTGSGEPLISPVLPDILKILAPHDCWVSFNTHGLFVDREKAALFVRTGVDEIRFSMDGACKETFEKIRVNASWEKFLAGIQALNDVKTELGSKKPMLVLSSNFMRQNIEELPELIDFAAANKAQKVMAQATIIYDQQMEGESLIHCRYLVKEMTKEAIRRAHRLGIEFENHLYEPPEGMEALEQEALKDEWRHTAGLAATEPVSAVGSQDGNGKSESSGSTAATSRREPDDEVTTGETEHAIEGPGAALAEAPPQAGLPLTRPSQEAAASPPGGERSAILKACQKPWTGLFVESDGSTKVCCFESAYVGNLNEQSFEEIWHGKPMQDLRRSFVDGDPPEGCANCFIFAQSQLRDRVFLRYAETSHSYIDAPEKDTRLEGTVLVHGWALDQSGIDGVELLIDGDRVGDAVIGHERPDVAKAFPGYPDNTACGFHLYVDTTKLQDGRHELALQVTNKSGDTSEEQSRSVDICNTVL